MIIRKSKNILNFLKKLKTNFLILKKILHQFKILFFQILF